MRLDPYLAQSGERTRSEAARLLRSGAVATTAAGSGRRLSSEARRPGGADGTGRGGEALPIPDAAQARRAVDRRSGQPGPHGDAAPVPESCARRKVLPVGRLDKDTTGLLLFTNDGELAHRLLSPKRHVWKTYEATVDGAADRCR